MNARAAASLPGNPALIGFVVLIVLVAGGVLGQVVNQGNPLAAAGVVLVPIFAFLAKGFFQVQPNQGQVMQLFGRY